MWRRWRSERAALFQLQGGDDGLVAVWLNVHMREIQWVLSVLDASPGVVRCCQCASDCSVERGNSDPGTPLRVLPTSDLVQVHKGGPRDAHGQP